MLRVPITGTCQSPSWTHTSIRYSGCKIIIIWAGAPSLQLLLFSLRTHLIKAVRSLGWFLPMCSASLVLKRASCLGVFAAMKAAVMTVWLKVEILFRQQSIYKLRAMLSCWELDALLPSASACAQMVHSLWTWRKDETLREIPCHSLLGSPTFQFFILLFVQDGGTGHSSAASLCLLNPGYQDGGHL